MFFHGNKGKRGNGRRAVRGGAAVLGSSAKRAWFGSIEPELRFVS